MTWRGICPVIVNAVLMKLFDDKTLSHGFGITKAFRDEFGAVTRDKEGMMSWTRTVGVSDLPGVRPYVPEHLGQHHQEEESDARAEILCSAGQSPTSRCLARDHLCASRQRVDSSSRKAEKISFVESVMEFSRPVLSYATNTEIDSYPHMSDEFTETRAYHPIINDDDQGMSRFGHPNWLHVREVFCRGGQFIWNKHIHTYTLCTHSLKYSWVSMSCVLYRERER